MTTTPQAHQGRVTRSEFLRHAARRADLPQATMLTAYEAIVEELVEQIGQGNQVTLMGFGKFYPLIHRGHLARSGNDYERIPDYPVMKFSATKDLNKSLRERSSDLTIKLITRPTAAAAGFDRIRTQSETDEH